MESCQIKQNMAEGHTNHESNQESYSPSTVQELAFPGVLPRSRGNSDVLTRILDENFLRSVLNYEDTVVIEETIKKLFSYLEKDAKRKSSAASSHIKSKRVQDVIHNLSGRYRGAFKVLLDRVNEWKPVRKASIQKLDDFIYQLNRNFKVSTIVRLVSSTVDVSGSVGGLLFRSEAAWATHALDAASFFGLCGLVSTVAEVEMSKRILDEVSAILEEDRELMQPVLEWFEESGELDSAVQGLFPYALDPSIVKQVQEGTGEVNDNLKIFKALLLSNVRKDDKLWNNKDFLHSVQLFAGSDVGQLWWNRIMYRKHPIVLDSSRLALQMEFGQIQSIIFQCIPALPLEQQRLTSLPVAGRIMLNLLTMYDSLSDLSKGAMSIHFDKMNKLKKKMSRELDAIENALKKVETNVRNTGEE